MMKRLCVRNLSPETTREDLYSLFGQVARVISIDLSTQTNHDDGSAGLGFVEIETGNLTGVIDKVRITELNGRVIEVRESPPSDALGWQSWSPGREADRAKTRSTTNGPEEDCQITKGIVGPHTDFELWQSRWRLTRTDTHAPVSRSRNEDGPEAGEGRDR